MAIFFVTGPVGVGKKKLANKTKQILGKMGKKVLVESIGEIMKENIEKLGVNLRGSMNEGALRGARIGLTSQLTEKVLYKLSKMSISERPDHIIITLPLSIVNRDGVVSYQLPISDMERMLGAFSMVSKTHKKEYELGYFVSLIDNPRQILTNMQGSGEISGFASSIIQILEWTTMEVLLTEQIANHLGLGRWAVLPTGYSDTNLAKIILDMEHGEKPHIVYAAHPISEILKMQHSGDPEEQKRAERYFRKIHEFKMKLQRYAVVISPIELHRMKTDIESDSLFGQLLDKIENNIDSILFDIVDNYENAGKKKVKGRTKDIDFESRVLDATTNAIISVIGNMLRQHTVYRDLHWFVRSVDEVIAYFPDAMNSPGAETEIKEAIALGKQTILVKDVEKKADDSSNGGGEKDSPFYVEKSLPKENVYTSVDKFFKERNPRYKKVEDVWYKIKGR